MKLMSRRVGIATALAIALTATAAAPANASVVADNKTPVSVTSSAAMPIVDTVGLDGEARVVPIVAIIVAAVAAGGTAHAMGAEAAKTAYYAGWRNADYQANKWLIRSTAIGLIGPVLGGSFVIGFQNQFYSML